MNKEDIIRKIKEHKKYVAFFALVSIVTPAILIPVMLEINEQVLYQKARDGILIEDRFLEHAEVVDYGGSTGRVLEPTDRITFQIYAKAGDWYHAHYAADFSLIILEMRTCSWGSGENFFLVLTQFE